MQRSNPTHLIVDDLDGRGDSVKQLLVVHSAVPQLLDGEVSNVDQVPDVVQIGAFLGEGVRTVAPHALTNQGGRECRA